MAPVANVGGVGLAASISPFSGQSAPFRFRVTTLPPPSSGSGVLTAAPGQGWVCDWELAAWNWVGILPAPAIGRKVGKRAKQNRPEASLGL